MKTIREIADELGVSKTAVRNEIAKQGLQTGLQQDGKVVCVSEVDEIRIITAFLKRRDAKLKERVAESTGENFSEEVFTLRAQVSKLELELKLRDASQKEKLKIYLDEIERLTVELKAKDEIINSQIQLISDMTKVSVQAQALHAGTIQQQLLSGEVGADQQYSEPEPEKKRGWFSRLFGF